MPQFNVKMRFVNMFVKKKSGFSVAFKLQLLVLMTRRFLMRSHQRNLH